MTTLAQSPHAGALTPPATKRCIGRRRYGCVICDAYFFEPDPVPRCDLLYLHQVSEQPHLAVGLPFTTILIDLTVSEETLLNGCHSTSRTEIRRAERSDGLSYEGPLRGSEAIESFVSFYAAHAPANGPPSPSVRRLKNLAEAGALALTSVRDGTGTVLVRHSYVASAFRARCLHSISMWREVEGSNERNRIARANRWCHWRDMLLFRQLGFATFDFGGYGESDPSTAGIAAFKQRFGGRIVEEYNAVVPVTRRGGTAVRVQQLRQRFQGFGKARRRGFRR